jgi:hypothetical protein
VFLFSILTPISDFELRTIMFSASLHYSSLLLLLAFSDSQIPVLVSGGKRPSDYWKQEFESVSPAWRTLIAACWAQEPKARPLAAQLTALVQGNYEKDRETRV